jgi:hypothetical protein
MEIKNLASPPLFWAITSRSISSTVNTGRVTTDMIALMTPEALLTGWKLWVLCRKEL